MSELPLILQIAGATGSIATLVGASVTLAVHGARTERQRRRDLHDRALTAITAYGEMPYRIRRRAPGAEPRAALSDDLSRVKAEVDVCQILLAADGHERISQAYDALYATARQVVGFAAHKAWEMDPIKNDAQMNMGDLYRQLAPFSSARQAFADDLRNATLPRTRRARRLGRRLNPFLASPTRASDRIARAPQDEAGSGNDQGDADSEPPPRGRAALSRP